MRGATQLGVLSGMVLAYTVLFSFYGIRRHASFSVGEWDLGILDQAFWTTTHLGLPFYNTYEGHSHFAYHNCLLYVLLLPFYWLYPHPQVLIVLQTVALAVGAVPVFLLARDRVGPRTGLVFAGLYLANFALHGINYHEVHETGFVVAPMLLALWGLDTGRHRWVWVGAVLAMVTREDMGILVLGLAVLATWRRRRASRGVRVAEPAEATSPAHPARGKAPPDPAPLPARAAVALASLSLSWTWLSFAVVIPYFLGSASHTAASRLQHLGGSPTEWLLSPLLRPVAFWGHLLSGPSLSYVLGLLAPLGFLSLLDLPVLLVAAPVLVLNLVSSFGGMHLFTSHYAGPILPFVFASAIAGCARVVERRVRAGWPADMADQAGVRTCRPAIVLTLLIMLAFDPSPLHLGRRVPPVDDHARLLQSFVSAIPAGASVSAPPHVWPHVTDRLDAWPFFHEGVDFVIADESSEKMMVFMRESGLDRAMPGRVASGQYVAIRTEGGVTLYRRAGLGPRASPRQEPRGRVEKSPGARMHTSARD